MAADRNRLATALGLDMGPASSSADDDDDSTDDGADGDKKKKAGADYEEAELAAAEDVTEAFKAGDASRVRDALKRFIEICSG